MGALGTLWVPRGGILECECWRHLWVLGGGGSLWGHFVPPPHLESPPPPTDPPPTECCQRSLPLNKGLRCRAEPLGSTHRIGGHRNGGGGGRCSPPRSHSTQWGWGVCGRSFGVNHWGQTLGLSLGSSLWGQTLGSTHRSTIGVNHWGRLWGHLFGVKHWGHPFGVNHWGQTLGSSLGSSL